MLWDFSKQVFFDPVCYWTIEGAFAFVVHSNFCKNSTLFTYSSTSGYSGSGPQVHDEIYELIKDNEDEIAIGRFLITSREHE